MNGQLNPDADATGRSETRNNTVGRGSRIFPSPIGTHPTPLETPPAQAPPPHTNNQSHNSPPVQYVRNVHNVHNVHSVPSPPNRFPDSAGFHESFNSQARTIHRLNIENTRLAEELGQIRQRREAEINAFNTAAVAEVHALQGRLQGVMDDSDALTEAIRSLGIRCERFNRAAEHWRKERDEWKSRCDELQQRINAYERSREAAASQPQSPGSPSS